MVTIRKILHSVTHKWIQALRVKQPTIPQVKLIISFLEEVVDKSWDAVFPADVVPIPVEDLKVILKFLPNTPETEPTINIIKELLTEGDSSEVN